MKNIFLTSLRWRADFNKIIFLFLFFCGLIYLSLFAEWLLHKIGFGELFLKLITFSLLFRLSYRTIIGLYYTFWTLALFLFIYLLGGIFDSLFLYHSYYFFQIFLLALLQLLLLCYLLSSPIFFPRVRWWVYDFRYRGDLVIKVNYFQKASPIDFKSEDVNPLLPGRITDLRRGAGCVVLFHQLKVGDIINIYTESLYSEIRLSAEVISVREYSFGRGYTHGIKFIFDDLEDKKTFRELARFWKDKISNPNVGEEEVKL